MQEKIKIVSIVGPTASGKTKLSVELAKEFNGEIISADSMQIYKGMQIATAKPDKEEMCNINHYLIDFLDADKEYSVASFVSDAKKACNEILLHKKLPFLVGGTGLYVDSFLNNINFSDYKRDENICKKLYEIAEKDGIDSLLDMLKKFDEVSYNSLKGQKNLKRIVRAVEFYKTTGTTITEQNEKSKLENSPYDTIKIGLKAQNRQFIYDRINRRVDIMIENGLIEEAKEVINKNLSQTSIKAIGYKELVPYFNNEKTLDECIETLKRETRRYAKRQLTWFKRDTQINWLNIDEYSSFEELYNDAKLIIKKGL